MANLKKCPRCELNYCESESEYCHICQEELGLVVRPRAESKPHITIEEHMNNLRSSMKTLLKKLCEEIEKQCPSIVDKYATDPDDGRGYIAYSNYNANFVQIETNQADIRINLPATQLPGNLTLALHNYEYRSNESAFTIYEVADLDTTMTAIVYAYKNR